MPMTTAHWLRCGAGAAAGAGGGVTAATLGGSYVTVRTSFWVTPPASVALMTIAFVPVRSVIGVVTTSDVCGVFSDCWATSTPLSCTLTFATPLPEVTTAAT